MLKTDNNPDGTPMEVFDGLRKTLAANRSQFYLDLASGPFYGFNRPGAKVSQGIIQNWWRQGMMGGAKAHYDGVKAFSETNQTEDLEAIKAPTLIMQGDDDQIVPYRPDSPLQGRRASGQAAREQHAQGLSRLSARHVHDECRRDQFRPARFHPLLTATCGTGLESVPRLPCLRGG
jgi:pimeloyl-ACP methyl ester carboxylesterase